MTTPDIIKNFRNGNPVTEMEARTVQASFLDSAIPPTAIPDALAIMALIPYYKGN